MAQPNNPMEIFKFLEKSNCKQCNEATCLAFAASVFRGEKQIDECPRLDKEIIEQFAGKTREASLREREVEEVLRQLKQKITEIDLASVADKLGGKFANGKLTLKILGKDFSIDSQGNFYTDLHVHHWLVVPVMNYVIGSAGVPVSGKWVPFRELKGGQSWERFFTHRCEKPMKKVADTYTELFEDMVHLFNGKQVENHYESDIAMVLHPLPRLPILICYWKPEDGLESSLNVFFDSTAEKNLNIESIYMLGTGLVVMFEKLALRHGIQ